MEIEKDGRSEDVFGLLTGFLSIDDKEHNISFNGIRMRNKELIN